MYTLSIQHRGVTIDYQGEDVPDLAAVCQAVDAALSSPHSAEAKATDTIWIHHPESGCVFQGERRDLVDDCVEVTEDEAMKLKAEYEGAASKETADAIRKDKAKKTPAKKSKAKDKPEEAKTEKAGEPEAEEAEPVEQETPNITVDNLRDQVMAYARKNGNPQAARLVQEVGGAKKVSDVPEDKRLELYKAAGGEV